MAIIVGNSVVFHFVASMPQHEDCSDEEGTCSCVEEAFIRRPASIVAISDEDNDHLTLDVEFEAADHELMGCHDTEGRVVEIPARQTTVRRASMDLPVAVEDSGTWTPT